MTIMRGIVLIILSLIIVGAAFAETPEKSSEPTKREQRLEIASAFLDRSYEVFAVQELTMPLAKHAYLLAHHNNEGIVIQKAAEFFQIVTKITSPEEALELVRLLTSQDIRPFLQDIYYDEVHRYVEPENEDDIVPLWFVLSDEQYERWNVQEPIVTPEGDGRYRIERFVASYPRRAGEEDALIPAQLLRIWEWVDAEGNYAMEIQDVVTEDDSIHNILLFTK